MLKYDVFISYRRDGEDDLNQLLYYALKWDGYRVFRDKETLRSGKFPEQIEQGIAESAAMLVVLSPHGLDRCSDSKDWVRQELEHAILNKKVMIPVMMQGFMWEEDKLPDRLKELPLYQGIEAVDGEFSNWYKKLKGYIDEQIMKEKTRFDEERRKFRTPGEEVKFGRYPQTAEGTDSTPIEWLVLDYDARSNRSLLLSLYGLDAQPYNRAKPDTDITWEKCTLRDWLNGEFLNKAFTEDKRRSIIMTTVDNSQGQGFDFTTVNKTAKKTNGGNNTEDKIFLLSYAEAKKYLGVQHYSVSGSRSNTKSRVSPTAYALMRGASSKTEEGTTAGIWWLRSPGSNQTYAALVQDNGALYSNFTVNTDKGCVRPALWLDLNLLPDD